MKVFASCWRSPWCKWISNDTFAFKAQRYFNNKVNIPIVIFNVNRGFAILPESNEPNNWFDDQVITDLDYTAYTDIELFNKVINS
ncbi:hypothetical protein [Kangiella sp. HZ709]|uniref:hypothetical protein n=1 Tax=Kangiella sp. HZ709 TaxID=2666328 RepID=UPI0012B001EF|nr:hypothetical protein [Kangiella sp. HZ709]MRX27627.1 hypothetical protein [Kangiella sp. HZ709]